MNEAPKIVSWRVVKTSSVASFFGSLPPSSANFMLAPVDLPIQLPLLRADEVRPLGLQAVERCQQLLGVGGDPEEPLRQVALLHHRARAPAAPVDHLLVGQHRLLDRVPVDLGGLAVGQLLLQEVQEQPLLVHVVVGIAGGELALPVDRQAHGLELAAHGVDVLVGPLARVDLALHGGVLGRQAEGVPAHGMQHVEALGAHVAGHDVAQRVAAHMPHVDAPRRVGEHLELVALGLLALVLGAEGAALLPHLLPVLLAHGRVVAFACHGLVSRGSPRLVK